MTESSEKPRRLLQAVAYLDGRRLACCVLRQGKYVIGHSRKCEIAISEPSVSARHALLTVGAGDELQIEDLQSANGTSLDGVAVTAPTAVPLGARLRLGAVTLCFEIGRLPAGALADLPERFLRPPRYRIGEIVVEGTTSTIYQARDTVLGREVAIRTLHVESQRDAAIVLRFIREAQITAQLCHQGILPVYDFGLDADGRLFLATRFIAGEQLSTILDRIAAGDVAAAARYDLPALLVIWQKVADVLACAHHRGVIHNSLTPDAVEVARFGEVFVTQWTYAAVLGAPDDPLPIEAPPAPIAPPLSAYCAPEQAAVQLADFSPRTDVFALGALLYRIITLQPPLAGDTEDALLEAALSAAVASPRRDPPGPHLPRGRFPGTLAAIAMKALAYDPAERPQSVPDLQREVAAWQAGLSAPDQESGSFWKQLTTRRS